jgi:hypothetical protein
MLLENLYPSHVLNYTILSYVSTRLIRICSSGPSRSRMVFSDLPLKLASKHMSENKVLYRIYAPKKEK